MTDLARTIFIVGALVASARARYMLGVVIAGVCAFVVALEIYFALRFPVRPAPIGVAFGAVLFGPSALPHVAPFAASAVLMNPLHHAGSAALGGGAGLLAFSRASRLPPHTDRARGLDRAGLRFLSIAVLHGLLVTTSLLMPAGRAIE